MFGIVVGAQKSYLHSIARSIAEFSELMVDIYQAVPRPMLHIMDALRGMDGQMGPSGGRVLKLSRLLAARNGVAMDSVMAVLAGTRPDAIPMIRIAGERGLGPSRPEEIEIVGDRSPLPGFRLPSQTAARTAGGVSALVYPLLLRRPIPVPERCTRCRECFRGCPVKAIRMEPTPVIDRKVCISCFCCVELCPERAFRIPDVAEAVWRNLIRR